MATKARAKKPAKRSAASTSGTKVMVGRFGSEPVSITVGSGATVGGVLEAANISVSTNEKVWLNGTRVTLSDKVQTGDIISIVTPKQAGL